MKRLAFLLFVVLLQACGGSSPSEPTVLPANIVVVSHDVKLTWFCGGGICSFQGEGKNTGAGCAANIRGIARLYDGNDNVLTRGDFTYNSRVKPNESFIYTGTMPNFSGTSSYYKTEFNWDNVQC